MNLPRFITPLTLFLCGAASAASVGETIPAAPRLSKIDLGSCERPAYPKEALAAGESGATLVQYTVLPDGSLMEPVVLRSSGSARLDDAAVQAFLKCKGTPLTREGQTVPAVVRIEFVWRLEPSIQPPTSVCPGAPDYPAESLRLGETGKATVRVSFDELGAFVKAEVDQSSGFPRLDEASLLAARYCKLKLPDRTRASPQGTTVKLDFVWKIQP